LKGNGKASIKEEAKVAFHTTAETPKTARKAQISGSGRNPTHWVLDSGASEHFTPHKHILINYKSLDEPVEVNMAQGKLHGIGTGNVHITVEGQDGAGMKVILEEVLHVPGMDSNLLSSNVLLGKRLEISMHPIKGTNILLRSKIIATTVLHGKLLYLKTLSNEVGEEEHVLKTVGRKPKPTQPKPLLYNIWHRCLVHLGP